MMYTLVSQQWVATCPLPYSEFSPTEDERPEQLKETETPFGHIRRFSYVAANTIEAQRIRARVTRSDLAARAGISVGALDDVIAARSIVSPVCASRMQTLFRRGSHIYPPLPEPHVPPVPQKRPKGTGRGDPSRR